MKIGPKYKIARRLGAAVFEKTQGQKFALSEQRKNKRTGRPKSAFGKQLIEKQKVRFTYGITEKQLANYVKKAILAGSKKQDEHVYKLLEKRLDSIILNSGFATTRRSARQMVSHGHVKVNNKKVTIPSYSITEKDIIEIKESSKSKGSLVNFEERFKDINTPSHLKVDVKNMSVQLIAEPKYNPKESTLDLVSLLQFYNR